LVTVRSEAEILETLDDNGTLDGLPFMPEMRRFCGRDFHVRSRADRTIADKLGYRRMEDAVHLTAAYCDGAAHDGCGRRCSLYWKERWLRRATGTVEDREARAPAPAPAEGCVRLRVRQDDGDHYFCQGTELAKATSLLRLRHVDLHLSAFWNESVDPVNLMRSFAIYARDLVVDFSQLSGPCVGRTPSVSLGLRPGEQVRVKSRAEILATLDARGQNRGLEFSREMLRFCGQRFTVLARVDRSIADNDAVAHNCKDTVILDGAVYNNLARLSVPREEYVFWHECWLERVEEPTASVGNEIPLAVRSSPTLAPAPPASRHH
jgi:hypothetical protein